MTPSPDQVKKVLQKINIKKVPEKVSPRWYELERLIPYRDVVFILGLALMGAGIARLSFEAGLIFGGVSFMGISYLLAKGEPR